MRLRRRSVFFSIFVAAITAFLFSAHPAHAQSLILDKHGIITDSRVNDILIDGDDVYIGGYFTKIGHFSQGYGTVHDEATGTLEAGWPEFHGGDATVVTSDGAGGWYVGGWFKEVGGYERNGLVHILSDKTVDQGWDPIGPHSATVNTIEDSGSYLYFGGYFEEFDGYAISHLARIEKSTGEVDTTWNPAPDARIESLVVSGSDIYAAGYFSSIGGITRSRIAKLNDTTGAADSGWDPNPNNTIWSVAVSGDDVYVGGSFTSIGGQSRSRIAKLNNTTGAADATWDANASSSVWAISISGSNIYVGGDFTSIGGLSRNRAAKLNDTTGAADAIWNPNANSSLRALSVFGSDVYVGGYFTSIGGISIQNAAKLNDTTGAADSGWNNGMVGRVWGFSEVDDKVFLAGSQYLMVDTVARNYLAKVSLSTKEIDETWNPSPNNAVEELEMVGDDLYLGGQFTSVGGTGRNRIARIDKTTGVLDATWNPGANGQVQVIKSFGSYLYVGGGFTTIGGVGRNYIARFVTSTGIVDGAWNPSAGDWVETILESDGYIYAGGWFETMGGLDRNRVAKLNNTTGAPVATWDASVDNPTLYMWMEESVDVGDDIYFAGYFDEIGGTSMKGGVKINKSTGIVDTNWDINIANTYGSLWCVSYQDGMIVVGGDYEFGDTGEWISLARVDPETAELDPFWNAGGLDPSMVTKTAFSGDQVWVAMEWMASPLPYFAQYTVESTPPVIIMNSFSTPTSDSTPSFTGTATDARSGIKSVQYQVDSTSGTWKSCSPSDGAYDEKSEAFSCNVTTVLSDGSHTIYVRATDTVDNTATSSNYGIRTFTVDTVPPAISITATDGYSYTPIRWLINRRPLFEGQSDANTSIKIQVYLNGINQLTDWVASNENGYWFWLSDTDLPLGMLQVFVTAQDVAGNAASRDMLLVMMLTFGTSSDDEDVQEEGEDEGDEEDTSEEDEDMDEKKDDMDLAPDAGSSYESDDTGQTEKQKSVGKVLGEFLSAIFAGEFVSRTSDVIKELNNSPEGRVSAISILTVSVFTGVASVAAVSGVSAVQIPVLFSFPFLGGLVGAAQKRKPWAVVYDSVTKEPLSRAVVRIYHGDELVKTTVTDIRGTFVADLGPGSYQVEVVMSKYEFPSALIKGSSDEGRSPIYLGGEVDISEDKKEEGVYAYIPMDPETAKEGRRVLVRARTLGSKIFGFVAFSFLSLGTLFSLWSLIVVGGWVYLIMSLANLGVLLWVLLAKFHTPGGWGRVYTEDGEPAARVKLGLYDAVYGKLIDTRVTDDEGRYRFVVPGGSYMVRPVGGDYLIAGRSGKGEVEVQTGDKTNVVVGKDFMVRRKALPQ